VAIPSPCANRSRESFAANEILSGSGLIGGIGASTPGTFGPLRTRDARRRSARRLDASPGFRRCGAAESDPARVAGGRAREGRMPTYLCIEELLANRLQAIGSNVRASVLDAGQRLAIPAILRILKAKPTRRPH
jgi:hypothetical protein